ncbi:hypothetical protein [Pedobacter caeni]|uniref:Uncharacterized protein n=1 Tax=Pedobacter caeni TaxID=288992 RepID=A0A1M5HWP8_9SPHI|nr:hypothetical protein [Pedobacter caeni]SHG20375.1 hypothetical protein SAMN04488522_104851 [Pedobacter caeni]
MKIETREYLGRFQKSADELDKLVNFNQKELVYNVGIWLDSVVLKIQNRSWLNTSPETKPFEESVFFSVWLNDESIQKGKIYYNIHALKLRQLTNYSIKSREFSNAFRLRFMPFEKQWPNVSVDFGPLTLMEGWVPFDHEHIEKLVADLASNFLEIAVIIEDLLKERKK